MKGFFEDEGYLVTCLHSGLGAYEQIIQQRPDVVVLDLDLPEVNGIEIYRKLRKGLGCFASCEYKNEL